MTCFSLFVALTWSGVGRHAEFYTYVQPELLVVFFQLAWWYSWIVVVAYTSIKISIACFLLQLADHRRHWRWTLYAIIGIPNFSSCGSSSLTRYTSSPYGVHYRVSAISDPAMYACTCGMGLQPTATNWVYISCANTPAQAADWLGETQYAIRLRSTGTPESSTLVRAPHL